VADVVATEREIARGAALAGGQVILEASGRAAGGHGGGSGGGAVGGLAGAVEAKGLPGDWVTEVDVAAERSIGRYLATATPSIPMHGEETGGAGAGAEDGEGLRWVVDPLDGTTNFIHGFPAVGVSVALVDGADVVTGAIHAPYLDETWHGARGEGAAWERPGRGAATCSVSERAPAQAVVGTGFPFRRKERLGRYLEVMGGVLARVEDLRRPGAACLDLAWVACGVFDGFFELGLAPWDVAAGGLLIREAGGTVSDWDGGEGWLGGDIVAGPPAVWEELVALTRG
jgi:myo-inositol-1(or 4)-monophosphatase